MKQQVVLATGNQGKVREFSQLLAEFNWEFVPQTALHVAEIPETGLSFVENALIKARHAAQVTGLPAMADDSGLVVDALNGAPGLYSARYAGSPSNDAANNQKLLADLAAIPEADRSARFYCCIVYLRHALDPTPLIAEATWQGQILFAPQGNNGFGYDPLFYVPNQQCSSAELVPALKNQLSHRGQALRKLYCLLQQLNVALHELD